MHYWDQYVEYAGFTKVADTFGVTGDKQGRGMIGRFGGACHAMSRVSQHCLSNF